VDQRPTPEEMLSNLNALSIACTLASGDFRDRLGATETLTFGALANVCRPA
jgi:hypothetical protein